ncbi:MAG: hypothetical protein CGU28_02995 [Candidatus Dactylopiibacterium carminicum]|uniref:Uncharacterized protein n=1 Tax=Candidatus Dactylopiibacterium carminicum TaxID=857335 RepID=A0A272EYC1_9RHOO|nr:hypothetical protein [Candidatus Dactylopiibacterium carminicum]KAF7600648.1 hypothetical protein BGI27_01830 [Candidatus Dactylopiibacterium carminicum]PAS95118.1 MAG: hypothetical protein CGU29_01340 [Candidatus Dactylopiibacterium carminicum]PAS97922.1 MAG: hypothetical protein CGU28_02995 [Candidatus Dactylopiibacterium carminicum]PAT00645.1 MAG: hypothetical protein BSR46_01840 [Candidatus Dactylopiibacterium carminicum]
MVSTVLPDCVTGVTPLLAEPTMRSLLALVSVRVERSSVSVAKLRVLSASSLFAPVERFQPLALLLVLPALLLEALAVVLELLLDALVVLLLALLALLLLLAVFSVLEVLALPPPPPHPVSAANRKSRSHRVFIRMFFSSVRLS